MYESNKSGEKGKTFAAPFSVTSRDGEPEGAASDFSSTIDDTAALGAAVRSYLV